jgi:hypothetical protein
MGSLRISQGFDQENVCIDKSLIANEFANDGTAGPNYDITFVKAALGTIIAVRSL